MISKDLSAFGGVLITGPRSCGKSWTGFNHSGSAAFLGHEKTTELAMLDPQAVLEGEFPRLVDEWQEVPKLWDVARRNIDMGHRKGMYIFTGSSAPPLEKTQHTGIGRFATLEMRTMSLFESGDSSGAVRLSDIFETGRAETVRSYLDYRKIINLICRGGWPGALGLDDDEAIRIPYQYVKSIINMDMSRVDGKRRSRNTVEAVLRSLARNNATLAGNSKLAEDVRSMNRSITEPTLHSYMDVLTKLYIIEEQGAWSPSLRSKVRVRNAPKRHFTDPSLAAAVLGARPDILHKDTETAGFLFESLCYRDISVYASALGGRVFHYRDNSKLEIDQIIQLDDGRWGAAEVKLGTSESEKAAANLLRMKTKMTAAGAKEPSFMMILNATGAAAHTRPDGIIEMPVDCLGP
jgi:predicted AAA+ superfamily ATPase